MSLISSIVTTWDSSQFEVISLNFSKISLSFSFSKSIQKYDFIAFSSQALQD
jgi:hypothetical protein